MWKSKQRLVKPGVHFSALLMSWELYSLNPLCPRKLAILTFFMSPDLSLWTCSKSCDRLPLHNILNVIYLFVFYIEKKKQNPETKDICVISQFSSVAQSCPTLCDPMDCSTPGFPVHHQLPELAQTHVHWVSDAIQPSHPLSSLSPPAFNLSQHQGLFQWVSSSHQVAKVLELQLQHQSFQWIFRTDFL